MFVDEVKVYLKAGNGGHGCMSFRRERFRPKGGPDGGNGGRGGDIILVCNENESDLTNYKYKPHTCADNGLPGKGSHKQGAKAKDKYIRLPPGTVIFNEDTSEQITELLTIGQTFVLLKGGKGGFGNAHYKSPTNQAPRQITLGGEGEVGVFRFIIKTIADGGLIGLPNAGKSSLMRLLTKAQPKTGSYPFTTLTPSVGIVEFSQKHKHFRLADIPGLIAGANQNKGLGHRFLRHVERCRLLLILLDIAGVDGRDPLEDYRVLRNELTCYSENLLMKEQLIIANKMDLKGAKTNLKRFRKSHFKVFVQPISCLNNNGIDDLRRYFLLKPRHC